MRTLFLILPFIAISVLVTFLTGNVFATHIQIHVRTDTIAEIPQTASDMFCLEGNFENIYIFNYYVKFPQRTTSSFRIIANGFSDNPYCGGTFVEISEAMPSNVGMGDLVELYSADPNADTTPPTQSNIQATNISQIGATISWTTNETATHTIKYDTTSGSYDSYQNTKSAGSGTSASGAL